MIFRVLLSILLWSSFVSAEEGTVRLRRINRPPAQPSQAMKTQKSIAAQVQVQNDYYKKSDLLEKTEKRRDRLKADLEFARIADPDRIPGIKKEIKNHEREIKKLSLQVTRLHSELTKSLKRSPSSVSKPVHRSSRSR